MPSPSAMGMKMIHKKVLIMTAVVAALAAAGYYLSGAYCSRFDYSVSWAWESMESAAQKKERCELAGCQVVQTGSYDDPTAFDEEYSTFGCVPR